MNVKNWVALLVVASSVSACGGPSVSDLGTPTPPVGEVSQRVSLTPAQIAWTQKFFADSITALGARAPGCVPSVSADPARPPQVQLIAKPDGQGGALVNGPCFVDGGLVVFVGFSIKAPDAAGHVAMNGHLFAPIAYKQTEQTQSGQTMYAGGVTVTGVTVSVSQNGVGISVSTAPSSTTTTTTTTVSPPVVNADGSTSTTTTTTTTTTNSIDQAVSSVWQAITDAAKVVADAVTTAVTAIVETAQSAVQAVVDAANGTTPPDPAAETIEVTQTTNPDGTTDTVVTVDNPDGTVETTTVPGAEPLETAGDAAGKEVVDTAENPDTGSTDTGSTDTGSTDTGSTDTGSTDTGSTDTGSTDSGSAFAAHATRLNVHR